MSVRRALALLIAVAGSLRAGDAVAWRRVIPRNAITTAGTVTIDPTGDVVVGGTDAPDRLLVAKLAGANGHSRWRYVIDGTTPLGGVVLRTQATAVRIDPAGEVIVGGIVSDGVAERGTIAKLSGTTSAETWRHDFDAGVDDVAVDRRGAIFATSARSVLRIAGTDGALVWRSGEGVEDMTLGPTGNPTVVTLSPTFEYHVRRLDAASGALVWERALDAPSTAAVGVVADRDDHVIVSAYEGVSSSVMKLDAGTGAPIWTRSTDGPIENGGITPQNDVVVVGRRDALSSRVTKLAGDSGAVAWTTVLEGAQVGTIAAGDGDVLVGGRLGCTIRDRAYRHCRPGIAKLDGATGALRWSRRFEVKRFPGGGVTAIAADAAGRVAAVAFAVGRYPRGGTPDYGLLAIEVCGPDGRGRCGAPGR